MISRTAIRACGMAVLGLAASAITPSTPAQARQFVPCNVSALNDAIEDANTAGFGFIVLSPNCTYELNTPAETGSRGPNGLPIIKGRIIIFGIGSTIERDSGTAFRIMEIASGGRLDLRNVRIAGGDSGLHTGGGILVDANGAFVGRNVVITENQGDNGGGLSGDRATVQLSDSTVSENVATGGSAGAIYNDGRLTLRDTRVVDNTADKGGGAIYNEQGGIATLDSSVVHDNTAKVRFGGGIVNLTGSTLRLVGSRVSGNKAATDGGGIFNSGSLTTAGSRIGGNTAGEEGGGLFNETGGTARLVSTRVGFNVAADGGGIFNAAGLGAVTRVASPVASNTPNNCAPPGAVPGC